MSVPERFVTRPEQSRRLFRFRTNQLTIESQTMTVNLNPDQALRIECLRICSGCVAEAKNAYFWINGEAKQQSALAGGVNQANPHLPTQFVGSRQVSGPITHGSGTIG